MLRRQNSLIIITSIIAILVFSAVVAKSIFFDLLIARGHSMSPTIRNRDHILVNKRAYQNEKPARGDIIAFGANQQRVMIKRVIGLPGDRIEIRRGTLYRNGKAITHEPYVKFQPQSGKKWSYKSRIVQDEHLFVMGDNRDLSVDSKDFGTIPYENLIGKAFFIYFPFSRLGSIPQ